MLSMFVLAAMAPAVGQIKLDAKRYREAVIMLAPDNVRHTTKGADGTTYYHDWKGSGDYDVQVLAADPDAPSNPDDDEEEQPDPVVFIEKEAKRLHAAKRADGGQTKTVRRGDFSLTLSYRRDAYGNVSVVESSSSPVAYVRTMAARADKAERALTDFTSMSFWTGGERVNPYGGEMPKDWTASFGPIEVAAPWPQSPETLPGDPAKGEGASYRFFDYDAFALVERTDGAWEPFETASKRPHPRMLDLDAAGRVTVEKTDAVEHGGKWVLRQRGTAGPESAREEWVAWVVYDAASHEWTMLAKRKKGAPWPSGLPFNPEESGSPAGPETWGEPDGERRRKVGDLSLVTKYGPTYGKELVSFSRKGVDSVVDVFRGSEARRVRDLFVPPKDGRGLPPVAAKHPNPVIDAGSAWKGEDFVSFVRLWTGDSAIFDVCAFTTQGGEPYAVHLVYMSKDAGIKGLYDTLGSIQGKDGAPIWPKGLGSYSWYVPGADFRVRMSGVTTYRQQAYKDVLYAEGVPLAPGTGKLGVLVFAPKSNPAISLESWHDLFGKARHGDKRGGKTTEFATNLFGADAKARESEWNGEILTTFLKPSPNDRATVVYYRPKGESDEAWRKFLEKKAEP